MPWPTCAPEVPVLPAALERAGAVPVFDWVHRDACRRHRTAEDVAVAPLADVARLVTTIVRGERSADGTVAGALEDGRLLAAAHRCATDGDRCRGLGGSAARASSSTGRAADF